MQRRATMNLGACVGLPTNLITHRLNITNAWSNGESFFVKKNYRWIIKCLNEGYVIATDVIEFMEEYCTLQQTINDRLDAFENKWRSKISQQSTLSSYHTTKRAQIETISSAKKLAQINKTRCDQIEQVIKEYKKQVNRMYVHEHMSFGPRKHYQADELERSFKNAYSHVSQVSDQLDQLREQKRKAEETLREAQSQIEILQQNETTSERKLSKANTHLEKKQRELRDIKAHITRKEAELNEEQEIYRERATKIYEQCRQYEQERLDQIRQTLILFTQVIHSSEYSQEQNKLYADLLSHLESKQNTTTDLNFWAQTYRIYPPTKSTHVEEEIDGNRLTTDVPTTTQ